MTTEDPAYYSRQQLAEKAGIPYRTFARHEKANVGNLKAAREQHPGLGMVYVGRKVGKYLALVQAAFRKQPKRAKPQQAEEVA